MVIAYLRISTSRQHLDNQADEIRRFARSRDMHIDRWVTEIVSGKKDQRERKLGRVIRQLKPGDTLIVTEISRLSRTLTEIMAIMGRCLEKQITIYSTKDGYAFDNTINSKVLCFAFGLVAEIERNLNRIESRIDRSATDARSCTLQRQLVTLIRQYLGLDEGVYWRDRCMAENLLWLRGQYPDSRIVFWGHNGHVSRAEHRMGRRLGEELGADYLNIGFTFHAGRCSIMRTKSAASTRLSIVPVSSQA